MDKQIIKALRGISYLVLSDNGDNYVIEYRKRDATLRDQQDAIRLAQEVLLEAGIQANIYREYTELQIKIVA